MSLIGRDVIGFDEFGNGGLILKNSTKEDTQRGKKFPLIVTGYLTQNYSHAQYGTDCFGSKRGRKFFVTNPDLSKIFRCSRSYFLEHPNFFYTIIPQRDLTRLDYSTPRANAIATLTLKFLDAYSLKPENTTVLIHNIDSQENSERIHKKIESWFEVFNLPIISYIKDSKAQKRNSALAAADMVGYYLGALKFFGNQKQWPFRSRKVDLEEMMGYAAWLGLI